MSRYSNRLYLFFCILTGIATGCSENNTKQHISLTDKISLDKQNLNPEKKQNTYSFGFDLRNSPQEDARQYLPFLKYLSDHTDAEFTLKFTPKNESTASLLSQGKFDFASVGATSFIKANQKKTITPLVRGLNKKNKATYQSMIVVSPNSEIKALNDLRNKRFAFGNIDSTQGHLIPRIILSTAGIELKDFAKFSYTGSHLNCAEAVIKNDFDACGMQDTLARTLEDEGKIKIIYVSDPYPSSGIATSSNVPPKIVSQVKQALLNFDPLKKHSADLHNWHLTEMPNGFTDAKPEDYTQLASWMHKLGFLAKD